MEVICVKCRRGTDGSPYPSHVLRWWAGGGSMAGAGVPGVVPQGRKRRFRARRSRRDSGSRRRGQYPHQHHTQLEKLRPHQKQSRRVGQKLGSVLKDFGQYFVLG